MKEKLVTSQVKENQECWEVKMYHSAIKISKEKNEKTKQHHRKKIKQVQFDLPTLKSHGTTLTFVNETH